MRKAGALTAAVLLVLALAAPGCDLVSSLTPFGIGNRDYGSGSDNTNGLWTGKSSTGGDVTMQVGSSTVTSLMIHHIDGACNLPLEAQSVSEPVVNNVFSVTVDLTQGRFTAIGTFTSPTTCSGSYSFEGLAAGTCPSSGSGTFTAQK